LEEAKRTPYIIYGHIHPGLYHILGRADARTAPVTQPKFPIAPLHTGVAEVTERIGARSQHTRHDYLGRMQAARSGGPRAAGFSACKLFPAQQAGGIGMLKALGGPFPDHVFCPTGGVTRANAVDYLALPNVLCVGGSWFTPPAALQAADWATIESLARDAAALGGAQR
jgi:KDPG/KHG aldolase